MPYSLQIFLLYETYLTLHFVGLVYSDEKEKK